MKKWAVAVLAALTLLGCAKNTAGLQIDGATQSVLFGDNVLAGRLKIDEISTSNVDGRARGIVRLESRYKGDQAIQYRFYWYDDDGLEVNAKLGPWRQAIVRGMEIIVISEVSVSPKGTQFRVQIRGNDN